jgi:hypothetical protein
MKDENGRAIVNKRFPSDVKSINSFPDGIGEAKAKVVMGATSFSEQIPRDPGPAP